jgi:murein DD-endopeptidase MepM/ murein hydrolase activator NlpD
MKRLFLTTSLAALAVFSTPFAQATFYAGLWRSGTDANYFSVGLSLSAFADLATERHGQNLRLTNLRTYLDDNGVRKWAGIWHSGTDANYFSVNLTLAALGDLATTRHGQGLRIVDIETYVEGGQRKWAAIWRSGNYANYYSVDLSLTDFVNLANDRHQQGLRLVDLETYTVNGVRKWAGLWASGSDANYFSVDLTLSELNTLATQRHQQGLRIVDLEMYEVNGVRQWAAIWRSGNYANYYTVNMDIEKFVALARDRHADDLRLVGLCVYDQNCEPKCLNTVVMPTGSYNYGITATASHCKDEPGTCSAPAPGANVWYRWPANVVGGNRYVRLSAVNVPDRFLTLPFRDAAVERRGIWRYGSGDWHHAGDYSRDDVKTFRVRASAPGKVIHVGWDLWSGNTVIVSHNVGGVTDAYRTIYMHLRNGADADCAAAWSQTMPWMMGNPDLSDEMAAYQTLLNGSGCPQNVAQRNPDADYWGTDSQMIGVSVGQTVFRGQHLAWAGMTGPGGGRVAGQINTHLHIFWAYRDPTNDEWYFFDPYGIYALPECYPAGITDSLGGDCVRYPIAWQGGRPQYPDPVIDFQFFSLRGIKLLDMTWEEPGATVEYARTLNGPWFPVDTASNAYRVEVGNELQKFYRLRTDTRATR